MESLGGEKIAVMSLAFLTDLSSCPCMNVDN